MTAFHRRQLRFIMAIRSLQEDNIATKSSNPSCVHHNWIARHLETPSSRYEKGSRIEPFQKHTTQACISRLTDKIGGTHLSTSIGLRVLLKTYPRLSTEKFLSQTTASVHRETEVNAQGWTSLSHDHWIVCTFANTVFVSRELVLKQTTARV